MTTYQLAFTIEAIDRRVFVEYATEDAAIDAARRLFAVPEQYSSVRMYSIFGRAGTEKKGYREIDFRADSISIPAEESATATGSTQR